MRERSVYVHADAKLKTFIRDTLFVWIKESGGMPFDLIDEYTAQCAASTCVQGIRRRKNASVFMFVLESDVDAKIFKRVQQELNEAKMLRIPVLILRYDAMPNSPWNGAPQNIADKNNKQIDCSKGSVEAALLALFEGQPEIEDVAGMTSYWGA